MPIIQRSDSIGANAVNDNVLSGNQYEFLTDDALVEMGFTQSATGLELDILIGSETIGTRMIPLIKTTSPVYPDDFVVDFTAEAGSRLVVRARNTTGGALTLLTTIRITPV